jgi:hypothetical protein
LSEVEPPRPEEEVPTEATIPAPAAPASGVEAELSDEDTARTQ